MTPLKAEECLQLARFALDHANEGAFWSDPTGRLLYANSAAVAALGYTLPEVLGLTLLQICPELTPELWTQFLKEVKSRDQFAFEMTLQSKEGRVFPVEMSVNHMALGNKNILCGFFRDINEIRH